MASQTKSQNNIINQIAIAAMGIWRNKLWILFLALVTMAVFAWHSAIHREDSARATLLLRYEQAYEGLTPNDTRFNINELLSEPVLESAIEAAGLTGTVTPEELVQCIAVGASGSQSPGNMYIATEYSVWLNNEMLPKRITARDMLMLLMESYKQYFLEHYGSNDSALDINWSDVENWEYLEFADIMTVKVNNLITYLEDLTAESGMYQYHTEGESFKSLAGSVANFRDIYLNKYTAYVTNNRLFRNAANYQKKLEYRRFLINRSLQENTKRYEIYQDALKMYDESMIAFVMVPLFDASKGLYMARTGVGMDNLTSGSLEYSEKIETNAKQIKTFDSSIKNAQSPLRNASKYETAEEMIDEIEQHLDSLIERIFRVKEEYEEYRNKNSIIFTIRGYGLISGYNLRGSVSTAVLAVLVLCLFYGFRTLRKEMKE